MGAYEHRRILILPFTQLIHSIHTVAPTPTFMKPSIALAERHAAVRSAASRYRTVNPRVFGSVLHGTDKEGSDLDLLVDVLPGATLFDLGGAAS